MNKKIKEKWIKALRSGEYEQGKNWLNIDGKYCCLGVLCELAVKEGVITSMSFPPNSDTRVKSYDGQNALLPLSVMKWAGFPEDAWNYINIPKVGCLTSLNDEGSSFKEIADIIEENL